jgi:polar amino acid transport system substrate-binding protein
MRKMPLLSIGLIAVLAAACSSGAASPSIAPTAAASASPAAVVSVEPSVAPSASTAACAPADLGLVTAGKLTIGTDNPAYPPYFAENTGGTKTAPWELGDPTNGNGFESAVAYAIAGKLGFTKESVTWVVVPFINSFAAGAKTFDFDVNQVTYNAERAQTADLSTGYYFGNQSLVVLKKSPLAKATTITELKGGTFGAQVGTTSLDAIKTIIAPTKEPTVYDTTDAAITALGSGTIDGIMVDLPTADFITNVQLDSSTIVGQFVGGTPEHFSAVLAKGSALTACVDAAIDALTADGTLKTLASKWLPFQDSVPVFKP